MGIKDDAFSLLAEWCDTMTEYRVTLKTPLLNGGLLCPACSYIHGRCADAVYPLMYMYSVTGDGKYREAAEGVVDYADHNLSRPDGSYYNDVGLTWRGITAFSALAIGETLEHFGMLVSQEVKDRWNGIFLRLLSATRKMFSKEYLTPNINYTAGIAALLAFAYRYTGNEELLTEARGYESVCRAQFDTEGLLVGESGDRKAQTKKCARPIDMGYNLEESMPLLVKCARWLGDSEALEFYTARTLDHLTLLLPDGGIDDSFGTRMNKWTYFGSRTSDGMLGGIVHIAGRDGRIARALSENLRLQRRCTDNGLLHAGLMQASACEPPCIHHTFTHAKALAEFCLEINPEDFERCDSSILVREQDGIRKYQSGSLMTLTGSGFTATVNASDAIPHEGDDTGGGTLSLLWQKDRGAILAATPHVYRHAEPTNMQFQRHANATECMSARFVSDEYSSDLDRSVTLSDSDGCIRARSEIFPLELSYAISGGVFKITLTSEADGTYILPIISRSTETVDANGSTVTFGDTLMIRASAIPHLALREDGERFFHQVGGFQYMPLRFEVCAGAPLDIEINCG